MIQELFRRSSNSTGRAAFTRVEAFALWVAVGMLGLLAVPAFGSGKAKSLRVRCTDNLGVIGRGYRGYAMDNRDRYPMNVSTNRGGSAEYLGASSTAGATFTWAHFRALSNSLPDPRVLVCPTDAGRVAVNHFAGLEATTARNAAISYGVGVEADQTRPAMILGADRSVTGGTPKFEFNGNAVRGNLGTNVPVLATVRWDERALHRDAGNVVRADGSVTLLSAAGLREALAGSGDYSNNYSQPGKSALN